MNKYEIFTPNTLSHRNKSDRNVKLSQKNTNLTPVNAETLGWSLPLKFTRTTPCV